MRSLRYNKQKLIIISGYIISVMCIVALPGLVSTAFSLLFVLLSIGLGYRAAKCGNRKASTVILLLPITMSVAQNVYLGLGVSHLTSTYLQILLTLHFLLITGIVILGLETLNKKARWAVLSIAILFIHSALLFVIYPANLTAMMSSIRNILSCLLFYCFGIVMNKRVDTKEYYRWIARISWLVAIFGLVERFVGLNVWQTLNISRLWLMKGIGTNVWGIPNNWYSAELIGGYPIRRMVSTFADPVNLGTFLFAAFMIAWYQKDKILTITLGLCCVLTVSKGALLGFLVFTVVYVWQRKKYRVFLPLMGVVALVGGLYFISYSLTSTTGSVAIHLSGFFSAFDVFRTNPLGLGVGNVGVLAWMFNESLLDSSVSETGIGMIIAQLGIVGISVYIFFFTKLGLAPRNWKNGNSVNAQRQKALYYTLLFSFIANAMFNEVALSPNSCGLYFIEMAFIQSTMNNKNLYLQIIRNT